MNIRRTNTYFLYKYGAIKCFVNAIADVKEDNPEAEVDILFEAKISNFMNYWLLEYVTKKEGPIVEKRAFRKAIRDLKNVLPDKYRKSLIRHYKDKQCLSFLHGLYFFYKIYMGYNEIIL